MAAKFYESGGSRWPVVVAADDPRGGHVTVCNVGGVVSCHGIAYPSVHQKTEPAGVAVLLNGSTQHD